MTENEARRLARRIAAGYHVILGDSLAGFYLHGSLAMGGFGGGSDIDFLVAVNSEPSPEQKENMIRLLLELDGEAPEKGFEMSAVLVRDTLSPRHPIPYCLHYSNAHKSRAGADLSGYCAGMRGLDPDLAAHFTVTRLRGEALIGPPPERMFVPVPREDYISSVAADIAGAREGIISDPVYFVLNLCRAAAACEEGLVLSKEEGASWGMEKFPEKYLPVLKKAAAAYKNGGNIFPADEASKDELICFADYSLSRLSGFIK